MPISRTLLIACLNAFAGLNGLAAALLAVLTVVRLFQEGAGPQALQAAVLAVGFAAGGFVCRWAAGRLAVM